MVHFVDDYISDDATLRRLELIEVVLTNCATCMWKLVPEKQRQAPSWIKKVRDAIRTQQGKLSATRRRETAGTPFKTGANGLYVASADTVLCKTPSAPPSFHDSLVSAPGSLDSFAAKREAVPTSGSSVAGNSATHFPTAHDGNTISPTSSPSTNNALFHRVESDPASPGSPVTAATTVSGDVVLVSSSGKHKSDATIRKEDDALSEIPIHIKRLSGGITNELFHVYDESCMSSSVVVRIFGKETERVISRESELFYQSLFVETFVRGGNFLIYEYLDNYETLPFEDMGAEMVKIAERIADFHVRSTVAARLDFNPPLVADASWKEVPVDQEFQRHRTEAPPTTVASTSAAVTRSRFDREANYTRQSLTKWADLIASAEIVEKVQPEKRERFVALAARMTAECGPLLQCLDAHACELGEGACHNDLLSANFMRHRVTGAMKIIDFDYTTRDYFLFDLANHFNEYPGLDCDYTRYFPSQDHIRAFVAQYRQHMREKVEAAHATLTADQSKILQGCIIPREREMLWTDSAEEEALRVDQSVRLVNFLSVCSHMGWAVWSLVQEAVSTLDVDFIDYAETRFNRALEVKDAALAALAANP